MPTTTNSDKTLIVILGPTGSGKTDLGIELARRYGTEIISADSRQFYKGMPIGTAQPSKEQLDAVHHHFIASREVTDDYASGKYEEDALRVISELFAKHGAVIAVGGSGLYIDALCHGMDDLPEVDGQLRASLSAQSPESLLERLKELDPEYYDIVDRNNLRRVARALEVCIQTGGKYSDLRKGHAGKRDFNIIKIGVTLPREQLYARIDRRVDDMIASGLETEARTMCRYKGLNALQTVGYREMFDYFDGKTTFEEAVDLIKRNSRRYAKRQLTWFSRDAATRWFSPYDTNSVKNYADKFAG